MRRPPCRFSRGAYCLLGFSVCHRSWLPCSSCVWGRCLLHFSVVTAYGVIRVCGRTLVQYIYIDHVALLGFLSHPHLPTHIEKSRKMASSISTPANGQTNGNGKAPQTQGNLPASSLVQVQPARVEDLQPRYAQQIKHDDDNPDAHGWYASMSKRNHPFVML